MTTPEFFAAHSLAWTVPVFLIAVIAVGLVWWQVFLPLLASALVRDVVLARHDRGSADGAMRATHDAADKKKEA